MRETLAASVTGIRTRARAQGLHKPVVKRRRLGAERPDRPGACTPNKAAMSCADTSSPPAASNPVDRRRRGRVGRVYRRTEIAAKSVAAAATDLRRSDHI